MKNIFNEVREKAKLGANVKIDFSTKTLTVGKTKVIDNGIYDGSLGLPKHEKEELVKNLRNMYHDYKYSRPSEKWTHKKHHYFQALPLNDIPKDDITFGIDREYAEIQLNLYVLIQFLQKGLDWMFDQYYWTDKHHGESGDGDEQLIIMRDWFIPF